MNGAVIPDLASMSFETVEADWPEPELPTTTSNLPDFPLDALPAALAEWAHYAVEAMQVPLDSAAMLALGACSFALSGKGWIRMQPAWKEGPNLYVVIVDESGANKSGLFREALRPLNEVAAEHTERIRCELAAHDTRMKIAAAKKEAAIKTASKVPKAAKPTWPPRAPDAPQSTHPEATRNPLPSPEKVAEDAARALADLEAGTPREPYRVTTSPTPEKVTDMLCEYGRVLWQSEEGNEVFDLLTGRYGDKPNMDTVLSAYDHQSIRVDRMGRPSKLCARPHLSILCAVQPKVIEGLGKRPGDLKERGLIGRLAIVSPVTRVGDRRFHIDNAPEIPEPVTRGYHGTIRRLLALPDSEAVVSLSRDARVLFEPFYSAIEADLRPGGDLEEVRSFGSKLRGIVGRIALAFHAIEGRPLSDDAEIGCDTIKAAMSVGTYLLAHGKRANALMGAPKVDETTAAEVLWKYIKALVDGRPGPVPVTVNELREKARAKFPLAADVKKALRELVDRGLVTSPVKGVGSKCGRPTEVFMVNPKALAHGQ
ncbi:MAG: DUF3987 domain-containing protein [Deltaproteobacteria bacterium]|nr:DUF3987 domain-containing protein [Deltaproteobacteria bacterium]